MGCHFLFRLAVGLAGKTGPNEVTTQGVAETRSQQVHSLLGSLLRALLQRTSGAKSGDKDMAQTRDGLRGGN